jgi:hypothetical protein
MPASVADVKLSRVLAALDVDVRGPLMRRWLAQDALLEEAQRYPTASRERLILMDAHRIVSDVPEV